MRGMLKSQLIKLCEVYGAHLGKSVSQVSNLVRGNGTFFVNLKRAPRPNGKSPTCTLDTAEVIFEWFDSHWPVDLEWPEGVPRPSLVKQQTKDAA